MSRVVLTFALSWVTPFCLPVIETHVELDDEEPEFPPPQEEKADTK